MRIGMIRGSLALAALLLLTVVAHAATQITIRVVDQGAPIEGFAVSVMASNGEVIGVTNASGEIQTALEGKYYRVKVNGVGVDGIFEASSQPVVIDIH